MRRTQVDIKERRKERCMRNKKQNGKGCRNVEIRDHFHTAIITNLRMEFQETAALDGNKQDVARRRRGVGLLVQHEVKEVHHKGKKASA